MRHAHRSRVHLSFWMNGFELVSCERRTDGIHIPHARAHTYALDSVHHPTHPPTQTHTHTHTHTLDQSINQTHSRRRGFDDFDETEFDRGACLARTHLLCATQLLAIGAGVHHLPGNMPECLRPHLIDGGDKALARAVAAGGAFNVLALLLLAANGAIRRVFPINALLIGGITVVKVRRVGGGGGVLSEWEARLVPRWVRGGSCMNP